MTSCFLKLYTPTRVCEIIIRNWSAGQLVTLKSRHDMPDNRRNESRHSMPENRRKKTAEYRGEKNIRKKDGT